MNNKIIGITSMYANPLHEGHVEMLKRAKSLCNKLIVICNNDKQVELKKGGKVGLDEQSRAFILESIKYVDEVVISIDKNPSVCDTLNLILPKYKSEDTTVLFMKGGDRFSDEIPEKQVLDYHKVRIIDGLGKKVNNSSDLLPIIEKDDESIHEDNKTKFI